MHARLHEANMFNPADDPFAEVYLRQEKRITYEETEPASVLMSASFSISWPPGGIEETVPRELLDGVCLLCSEEKPEHCHRRLVAEYLNAKWGGIQIHHIA